MAKRYHVTVNGRTHEVTFHRKEGNEVHFSIADTPYVVSIEADTLARSGAQFSSPSSVPTPSTPQSQAHHVDDTHIYAPMPGLVVSVSAKAGETVSAGDTILVLEAMKMENAVSAPRDATVVRVCVTPGEQVESGSLLIELEENE